MDRVRIRIDASTRAAGLLALLALLSAAPALAHEQGGDRAMGVVRSVTDDRIVIEAADGHPVEFTLTEDTRFLRGDEPARREEVRTGERAVVHGRRSGGSLEAVRVKLGPSARSR